MHKNNDCRRNGERNRAPDETVVNKRVSERITSEKRGRVAACACVCVSLCEFEGRCCSSRPCSRRSVFRGYGFYPKMNEAANRHIKEETSK